MGKAALLLVAAAALAGGGFLLSAQLASRDTEARQNEHRADVLAREAARSVHALVLDQIVDLPNAAFRASLGMPARFAYAGGEATVTYLPDLMANVADFTVRVEHTGALHEIRSQYTWWQAMRADLPSPVIIQAPWATLGMAPGAAIEGERPVLVDRHPFTDLGLHGLLDLEAMQRRIAEAIAGSASTLRNTGELGGPCVTSTVCFTDDLNQFLGRLRAPTLFELYAGALSAADTHPGRYVLHEGSTRLSRRLVQFGTASAPAVVHVTGDATVAAGASVRGHGILLVEGSLVVEPGASLEWDGLVLIFAEQDHAEVRLEGRVTIRGALAAMQDGAPPGGHMDVTVWRDLSGVWTSPVGTDIETPRGWGVRAHAHTHRFDHRPGGRDLFFFDRGRTRHEGHLKFNRLLRELGSRRVYLEIANPNRHGLTRFEVETAEGSFSGGVRTGWGDFADTQRSPYQSRPFRAHELRRLSLHVRSLRLLFQGFDGASCDDYPRCISEARDRLGTLALRVRDDATHDLLYETGIYWHRKHAHHRESLEELAAEQQWRDRISAGEAFGLHIAMGDDAKITYSPEALAPALGMIGFGKPSQPVHLASWTRHFTAADVAAGRPNRVPDLATEPTEVICRDGQARAVTRRALSEQLAAGATLGPCPPGTP